MRDLYIAPLERLREKGALVQCITNFVTVNDCANIILASGGSLSMAQDIREVEEAVEGVQALVCNLGAIDQVDSMIAAGKKANWLGKPVILDPVAAGGTQLRRDAAGWLLREVKFTAIRGNASEIRFLAGRQSVGSGVDVSVSDAVTEENLPSGVETALALAQISGAIVVISGALDIVSDGRQTVILRNGCPTMARITGSGCMLTSLIGAFCGAWPGEPFQAVVSAVAAMGVCGEMAEERRIQNETGNASFRTDLIDAMFKLTTIQLKERIRYEIYEK